MLDYLRRQDWAPRSMRRKEKHLSRAFHDLEQQLQRPAKHEEVAKELGVDIKDFNDLLYQARGLTLLSLNRPTSESMESGSKELSDTIADEPDKTPFELLRKQETREMVADRIDKLPEKERLVISLYYYNELTMKEIGKILEVTESRVSQLHSSAVLRLRGFLESHL